MDFREFVRELTNLALQPAQSNCLDLATHTTRWPSFHLNANAGCKVNGRPRRKILNKEVAEIAERGSVLTKSWHSLKVTDLKLICGSNSTLFEISVSSCSKPCLRDLL